jgi:hypothetical protein
MVWASPQGKCIMGDLVLWIERDRFGQEEGLQVKP